MVTANAGDSRAILGSAVPMLAPSGAATEHGELSSPALGNTGSGVSHTREQARKKRRVAPRSVSPLNSPDDAAAQRPSTTYLERPSYHDGHMETRRPNSKSLYPATGSSRL